MIQTANQTWRQQAALSDLSSAIRQSTSGLRPEIANGAKATPEAVNAKTLFGKVNRLYDKATPNGGNRLADAIGQESAQQLLRHVDSMYLEAQKIAARDQYAAWRRRRLDSVELEASDIRRSMAFTACLASSATTITMAKALICHRLSRSVAY